MSGHITTITRKARKAHRCVACNTSICRGETYERWVVCDGGRAWSLAYHPECREAEDTVNAELRTSHIDEYGFLIDLVAESGGPAEFPDLPQVVLDRLRSMHWEHAL